jgi:beta-N-acetylhexosaminidase
MATINTLSKSFGYHLILGLSGVELSDFEKSLLERLRPAGIILFERNFDFSLSYDKWISKLSNLLESIYQIIERDDLLVCIDHEGGRVCRTPAPITRFPYAHQFKGNSYEVAKAVATELKSIGVNLSFAPVADIHSNPINPVIGVRSFATTADKVAKFSSDYYKGLVSEGILGCAKHFPGHGDTSTDSHHDLPFLKNTLEELKTRELIPFKELIASHVDTIMTAHVLFEGIDAKNPVTLSPYFLKELLRDELKFKGVLISDDLEMAAVANRFTKPKTLEQAFVAGNDMFIIARSPWAKDDCMKFLEQDFATSYQFSDSHLEPAKERVKNLLTRATRHKPYCLDASLLRSHNELNIKIGFE